MCVVEGRESVMCVCCGGRECDGVCVVEGESVMVCGVVKGRV